MNSTQPPDRQLSPQQVYAYPGGTLHIASWVAIFAGLTLIGFIYFVGGLSAFRTTHGLFFVAFGLLWIFAGFLWEWDFRNQIGRVVADDNGLTCTLPWGRRHNFQWDEILEVRCISRRFHSEISAWEIRGPTPKDRIIFTWELKGYKELLWTIRAYATQMKRFDADPEDMVPPMSLGDSHLQVPDTRSEGIAAVTFGALFMGGLVAPGLVFLLLPAAWRSITFPPGGVRPLAATAVLLAYFASVVLAWVIFAIGWMLLLRVFIPRNLLRDWWFSHVGRSRFTNWLPSTFLK